MPWYSIFGAIRDMFHWHEVTGTGDSLVIRNNNVRPAPANTERTGDLELPSLGYVGSARKGAVFYSIR